MSNEPAKSGAHYKSAGSGQHQVSTLSGRYGRLHRIPLPIPLNESPGPSQAQHIEAKAKEPRAEEVGQKSPQ